MNVFVLDIVGTTTHSTAITQADDLDIDVSVACHNSIVQVLVTPVVPHKDILGELTVVVPHTEDQMFTFVVDHAAHHVATFTVLVVAVAVAFPEYVCVIVVVGVPHTVIVVAAQPSDKLVVVVLNAENVAHHTTDVVNVGDVQNTTTHVPVSSLNAHASLALVLIPANQISLIRKLIPSYNNS